MSSVVPYKVEVENKSKGKRIVVDVEASSNLAAKNRAEKLNKGYRACKAQTLEQYLRQAMNR
jgi:DNA-binding transcriptional regulator YbjK